MNATLARALPSGSLKGTSEVLTGPEIWMSASVDRARVREAVNVESALEFNVLKIKRDLYLCQIKNLRYNRY